MNTSPQQQDPSDWIVLVNDEEQYSLWRESRPVPAGWQRTYGPATEAACIEHVEAVWTDMRPKSTRPSALLHGSVPVSEQRLMDGQEGWQATLLNRSSK